jgi:cytochrome c556
MSSRAWVRLGALGLALGICGVAAGAARFEDEDEAKATKEAQQAVLKLVETVRGGGDGKALAEAIHGKFPELKVVMNIFKPSSKGGLGVGAKGPGDGIEQRLLKWSQKKNWSADDLAKNKEAMQRAAEVSRALAEVADFYPPSKDVEKWKKYDQEMRKGSEDLLQAVGKGDPRAVRAAVLDLNGSCTSCHGDFRDN